LEHEHGISGAEADVSGVELHSTAMHVTLDATAVAFDEQTDGRVHRKAQTHKRGARGSTTKGGCSNEASPKKPRNAEDKGLGVLEVARAGTIPAASAAGVEQCVSDMTPEEVSTLTKSSVHGMLTLRAGEHFEVKGNGTCWLYAVMGSMRMLEHGTKKSLYTNSAANMAPTNQDVRFSEVAVEAFVRTARLSFESEHVATRTSHD